MLSAPARIVIRMIAIGVAVFATYRFALLPWRADHILAAVEKRTHLASDAMGTTAVLVARRNLELLDSIAPASRTDANYYMLYAFNQRMLGNPAAAVTTYTEALRYAD